MVVKMKGGAYSFIEENFEHSCKSGRLHASLKSCFNGEAGPKNKPINGKNYQFRNYSLLCISFNNISQGYGLTHNIKTKLHCSSLSDGQIDNMKVAYSIVMNQYAKRPNMVKIIC